MAVMSNIPLIAKFMGPTRGPSGADRTQVGPCWPHEHCLQGPLPISSWQPTLASEKDKSHGSSGLFGSEGSQSIGKSMSKSMPSIAISGGGQVFSDIAYCKGVLCAIKHIRKEHLQLTRTVLMEFNEVTLIVHSTDTYDKHLTLEWVVEKRSGFVDT